MRAVHVGVGHDDDPLIAQILIRIFRARAAAQRQHKVGEFLVLRQLARRRARDIENFSAQGKHGLGIAVARLLGRAAGAVAFDQEDFRARRRIARAIRKLAGQAQLARRGLAGDFFFLLALQPVLGLIDHEIEQPVGFLRTFRQPMIEMVAHHILDQALRIGGGEFLLGLALKFRLADEDREHGAGRGHDVVGA